MTRNYATEVDTRLARITMLPEILKRLDQKGVAIVQFCADVERYRLNGVLDWWPISGTYRKVDGASNDAYMKTRAVVNKCRDGL